MKTLNELNISRAPWQIAEGEEFTEYGYVRDADEKIIANAWLSFDEDKEEMCANARLIAAAPELYEAMRELCEWLSVGIKKRGSINPHWAKAMDALAKASGESKKE